LNEWHETYGPQGLTIIGIQGYGELSQSFVDEQGLRYPILDDPARDTWAAYGMQFHPSWAFIGSDGSLVHRQVGQVVLPSVVEYIEEALGSR
jgi:hypothetical protein